MRWLAALCLLFTAPAFTEENQMKKPVIKIETNVGSFEVTLFPDVAPKTCENFIKLAEMGKYNGIAFHRIIPNFMIQGGDYENQNGTGGKSIWGKEFEDECTNTVKFDKAGYLAMANRGPNTNGSQFFVTTAATSWLNMKHTIFGQVTQGYEVVKKIEGMGSQSGMPSAKVEITKITVVQ